jgi:hypothetical protein
MAEKEGLVLLRKIFSRPPMVSHLRFAPSNPMVRISSFFQPFCGFALNGGEGGIRTPGAISSTTDFESVTFGHSATSPKIEKRSGSNLLGKPGLKTVTCSGSLSTRSCRRAAARNGHSVTAPYLCCCRREKGWSVRVSRRSRQFKLAALSCR